MHNNSHIILEIYSAIITTFNVNIYSKNRWWINQKNKIYAIEETVSSLIYIQEKFSSPWLKEIKGIQPRNIPDKICDKRKTQWNERIANNK